jgi:hypothetical protein
MAVATLTRQVRKMRQEVLERMPSRVQAQQPTDPLVRYRCDPSRLMLDAGLTPDPWQRDLLRSSPPNLALLCSRQAGKSQLAAALALKAALLEAPALVLILSPTERQSGELFQDKLLPLYNAIGRPIPPYGRHESALRLRLANGSRILALPGKEATVRCYSGVRLLIIDEAARVPDSLYYSVRPMLAVSRGRVAALTTPWGKRGWFYEEWTEGEDWHRVMKTAHDCPRITPQFLEAEKKRIGDRWYRQEYECSFEDMIGAVFAEEDIRAALSDEVEPLFGG